MRLDYAYACGTKSGVKLLLVNMTKTPAEQYAGTLFHSGSPQAVVIEHAAPTDDLLPIRLIPLPSIKLLLVTKRARCRHRARSSHWWPLATQANIRYRALSSYW